MRRTPDEASERRLDEIRREASSRGVVEASGIRPPGAPFPRATPQTGYYGLPLLKAPPWTWEVPLYFFTGGAAGAAAVIAVAARGRDCRRLARHARAIAAIGGILSPALLTSDLGRPERFANMLRVFKIRSPMSVGAWTLAAFSSASAAAALADVLGGDRPGPLMRAARAGAGAASAATGLVLSTYTGVLIGATAIPVWSESAALLPAHFGASGLASAAALLETLGHEQPALNRVGVAASAVETVVGARIESRRHPALEPLKRGVSGLAIRAGGLLSGPLPLALRLLAPRSKRARRLAAISALAGSLLTRIGWIAAGRASA